MKEMKRMAPMRIIGSQTLTGFKTLLGLRGRRCIILLCLLLAGTGARAQTININNPSSGTGYTWNSQTQTLVISANGTYTINGSGSTSNRIKVNSGLNNVNITLNNVNINASTTSAACAFNMAGATVNLTLEGNNILKSGAYTAGLQVQPGATLAIDGTGSLEATGGSSSAGIGGAYVDSPTGGSITINGGRVTANGGGNFGAGIGGGWGGAGGNITINGGMVTANGNYGAAGIGGGYYGVGGSISITGGTVTANGGGFGAGIGGGADKDGGTINISGGTIIATGDSGNGAEDIGKSAGGSNSGTLTITGGSINATNGSVGATPTNGIGGNVYLNTLTVGSSANASKAITEGNIGGTACIDGAPTPPAYGINDVVTDAQGNVYFWLTQSSSDQLVELNANSAYYGKSYTRTHITTNNTQTLALLTYSITLSQTTTHTFTAATYGYGTQTNKSVTVTNNGDMPTGTLTVGLSGTNAASFTLSKTSITGGIAVNNNDAFTVVPNTGLAPGTYTATVTVSGSHGISKTFDVSFEVTPKNLTIDLSVNNKEYDGGTTATCTGTPALNGVISPDNVTLSGGTPTFSSKDAANNIPVNFTNFVLGGTHASNYTLTQPSNITANITAKELTIDHVGVNNKVYDGGTAATFTGTPALVGVISPDNVTLSGGAPTFADKNAGNNKAIGFSPAFSLGGTHASNYTLTQPSGVTANITAKELTINNVGVNNKVYNGNTEAAFAGTPALVGVISPDNVTLSGGTPTFADKNAGNNKAIGFSPAFSLGGTHAGNYTLTQPSGVTANITAKDINVTGVTIAPKTYSGSTAATVTGVSFIGLVETLTKDVDYSVSGAFNSASAGSGNKTVQATVTLLSTTNAGNYHLTGTGYSLTGQSISKKNITVTGGTITPKIYDGTASATVTELTFAGLENSETLAIGTDYAVTSAAFDNAGVGSNKTVRMNVALVGNTTTDNYNLTNGINYDLTGQRIDEFLLDLEALEDLGVTVDLTKTPVEVTVPDNVTGLGDITVRYNGRTRIPDEPGTYEVTVDITPGANYAGATGIVVGTITIPEPVDPEPAQREVILPSMPGFTTDPPAGSYSVSSGDDFVFTLTPAATQALLTPVIAIGRINGAGDDGVEITPNGDGSYTVRIRQVRQPLTVVIDFTTANNAIGSSRVWSHAGTLHITAATAGEARIYSVSGGLAKAIPVAAGATVSAPLPAGFYVVVLDGKPYKVFVE